MFCRSTRYDGSLHYEFPVRVLAQSHRVTMSFGSPGHPMRSGLEREPFVPHLFTWRLGQPLPRLQDLEALGR